MTRDAVLIRTEGDFKWKELENKEKEQKSYTGHTQNLGPLVRSIPADWLEEIHILHLFFRLPLEEKDVNWVMKKPKPLACHFRAAEVSPAVWSLTRGWGT